MKKIIFLFIGLTVLYAVFLKAWAPNFVIAPTSQIQTNQIKAEQVAFAEKPCRVVLVGSSLLARFEEPYFSDGICNLAMGGESSATGLAILLRSNSHPQKVVIEVNVQKDPSAEILNGIYKQPIYFLKQHLNFLRVDRQPVTLLYSKIRSYKSQFQFGESFNPAVYESQLALQKNNFAQAHVDASLYEALKRQADELQARGIAVVWLQLPVDRELEKTQYFTEMKAWFADHNLKLQHLDCQQAQTTDGLHLVPASIRECIPTLVHLINE